MNLLRLRRLTEEHSLSITRYRQEWSLLPGHDRVVHARMTTTHSVKAGTYELGFKSLVDGVPTKSVRDVRVTNFETGVELFHKEFVRNGYQFVQWWFEEPLETGDVATTVVEYEIYGGVRGCDVGTASNANMCTETFQAPWANFWKIPVLDVAYSFELLLPGSNSSGLMDYSFSPESLTLIEPRPCCLSDGVCSPGDNLTKGPSLYQYFAPYELRLGSESPKGVEFGWTVTGTNVTYKRCGSSCFIGGNIDNSSKTSSLLWIILIISGALVFTGFFVFLRRRKEARDMCTRRLEGQRASEYGSTEGDSRGAVARDEPNLINKPADELAEKIKPTEYLIEGIAPTRALICEYTLPDQEAYKSMCTVCMSTERNMVFLPCAHRATCTTCGNILKSCPICRKTIQQRIQTFDG